MPKKVLVVVDPVQVDSIYLQGCRFWNCSKFLRKQLGDWRVGVRSGLAGAVAVVGSIVTPWRCYGNSVERGTDLNFVLKDNSKQKQQKDKNNKILRGSQLSPSYMDKKTRCQRSGSEVCITVFLFHNSEIGNPLPRWS